MRTRTTSKFQSIALLATSVMMPASAIAQRPSRGLPLSRSNRTAAPVTNTNSQYRFVTIDTPSGNQTKAFGINNVGLVAGAYSVLPPQFGIDVHAFLWQNGALQTVDKTPDSTYLGASTDWGTVIGNYGTTAILHAATYNSVAAAWNTLPDVCLISGNPTACPSNTYPVDLPQNLGNGINDSGVATGAACDINFYNCVSWTWNGQQYSFFTDPAANLAQGGTYASGINNPGRIAGQFWDAGGAGHGFLKDGNRFTTFDVPAAVVTGGNAINDTGAIAGYYLDQAGNGHGFIRGNQGQIATVDVPGTFGTVLTGINDRGDLTGFYLDQAGNLFGFVALKK